MSEVLFHQGQSQYLQAYLEAVEAVQYMLSNSKCFFDHFLGHILTSH